MRSAAYRPPCSRPCWSRPSKWSPPHGGLRAYQSQIELRPGRMYLVRAIVAEDADPPVVVTVYRTRKIAKYWREP